MRATGKGAKIGPKQLSSVCLRGNHLGATDTAAEFWASPAVKPQRGLLGGRDYEGTRRWAVLVGEIYFKLNSELSSELEWSIGVELEWSEKIDRGFGVEFGVEFGSGLTIGV